MKIKQIILIIITCVFFLSCKTTKVLYQSNSNCSLTKIGIADINIKDSEYSRKFPQFDSIFNIESILNSKIFLSKEVIHVDEDLSYQNPDTIKIINLCKSNNLDALILTYTEIWLSHTRLNPYTHKKFYMCDFYTKIIDKNGKLLYCVVQYSKNEKNNKSSDTYNIVHLSTGISYEKIHNLIKK
jgi:hypothetical protein